MKGLGKQFIDFFCEICQGLCCEHIYPPLATYDKRKNGIKIWPKKTFCG